MYILSDKQVIFTQEDLGMAKKGKLKTETDSLLIEAKSRAIRTHYVNEK